MNRSHYAITLSVAASLLAGCGGSQPPTGVSSAIAQRRGVAAHIERIESGMPPKAKGDLLYVSQASGAVYVFSYPDGRSVGTLIGLGGNPDDVCADPAGHVFVTEFPSSIQEYARDKK